MTATAAPSAARALATAAPIPLEAPVTIATFPANFFISAFLWLEIRFRAAALYTTLLRLSSALGVSDEVAVDGLVSRYSSESLSKSCFSRYKDAARSTKSFIRKATFSVIAGKPPADAAQPSGIKGMIVVVPTNDAIPPSAPRTPAVLFQNPMNRSAPKVHSETPRNQQAPLIPKTGYIQAMSGPLLIYGMSASASYSNHFWYPKKRNIRTIEARST